ncbi:MAG TPA: tyrosine-type recombinase/integrase [Mycobacteriales bacterium]|nr:tyrosine-type recombinase/integrase [Mycobacteriales bacterium]
MTAALADQVTGYLALRRGLGYKLVAHERILADLVDHLESEGIDHLSVDAVIAWAVLGPSDERRASRLSVARRFARYLSAFDPATQIPPTGIFPAAVRRTPYLYSPGEISSLMAHARRLDPPLWAASVTTMVGLMATTGIRPGEARRAARDHLDPSSGQLSILDSKNGRSRRLPLHPSTVKALRRYLRVRDSVVGTAVHALFVDPAGGPISSSRFSATFRELTSRAGIIAGPGRRPPRAGDLRHSFAVSTLAAWHAEHAEVAALLPVLSAYMGHLRPNETYWYLEAAPELMSVVAERLASWERTR